ncbi:MAG: ABC transporter ATP-binding protein [Clostridiales bacterium]|jgi:ABC-type dipeptide/oligopeptide/nickel transport system ATPase subunit|nr:MAG: ABC transporter ATP-binding protein [Clostridiales bacterium]
MMLRCEQLCKSYRREQVLRDVTLELRPGEILGLVGESGCGKSTLARLLCCYERPTSGQVLFRGRDAHQGGRRARRQFHRACQLILQDNLTSLDPTMTVGATLREAVRYNRDWDQARSEREIGAMLDRLLLERTVLQKRPIQLSGGQRQRVNIARALLVDPEVLICDEITSSLDVLTQYRLLELLRQLNRETGLPMLFISHDIQGVKRVSDRVLVMHRGQITEELHRADGFACSGTAARRLFAALPIDHPGKRQGLARHFAGPLFSGRTPVACPAER